MQENVELVSFEKFLPAGFLRIGRIDNLIPDCCTGFVFSLAALAVLEKIMGRRFGDVEKPLTGFGTLRRARIHVR
jgi:hypothetical protein